MNYEILLLWILYWIWWGIAPGPLNLFLIKETISSWFNSGLKISLSPLITDAPIIIFCFYLYNYFEDKDLFLASVSILWAIYIIYLVFQEFINKEKKLLSKRFWPFLKWVIINFLNPNSYIFWFTIGVAVINEALSFSLLNLVLFFSFFYFFLISSKILLSYISFKMDLLNNKNYIWINRALAFLMLSYWAYFLIKSYEYF